MENGVQVFTLNADDQTSTIVALQLTQAPQHTVLRLTGGSGNMDPEIGRWIIRILTEALADFEGAILFGGTRIVRMSDPNIVFPTVQEVPAKIKQKSTKAKVLGVVPRASIFRIVPNLGMVIYEDSQLDQVTIIHPQQDMVLQVQKNVDDFAMWDAEWRECMRIINDLRTYAKWQPLLISCNGGSVTGREIKAWAQKDWPVLLIKGGGRVTDELANNQQFLAEFPNVRVADLSVESIKSILLKFKEGEKEIDERNRSEKSS